ncbi:hypothetical protein [Peribacillus frigoritolerans]|uniref:hypothetical protein n=1 Tax=Peribacillus frigoritolerans TaxID=450367 RepID=UPI0020C14377|nr:hypothetical protein [Peribacillus frigoritolerans]MEE3952708.1 hypothetical protein [Peribacillus frigoritolerans]
MVDEEKDFLVYMKYEYKEGMYCQDCRGKIANGALGVYYECLEIDDYFLDQDLPGELWESRVRRQSKDGYEFVKNAEKAGDMGIVPAS